mmetsp:Transcript_29254/g.74407  ORF Transcript_29254/g.74407 Transcript_29254/m.74407 type:complete len:512 (+) Transcript_29254:147-1682(+)
MPCPSLRSAGLVVAAVYAALPQVGLGSAASEQPQPSQSPGQFTVPLHRQRVPVRSDTDTISYKSVYFGTISVGAPVKQHFSVVFDTGSGHVIVPSVMCNSETCRIHNRYDRQASKYAVDVDYDGTRVLPGQPRDQITVAFGTGEVTGQFVSDKLCLGKPGDEVPQPGHATVGHANASVPATEVATQRRLDANASNVEPADEGCIDLRVVMATQMTHEPFHAFAFDGVLGLGLDGLALAPEFSFFGMMIAQGRVTEPSFGVFLADNDDEVSELCFGGHAPDKVRGGLTWAPVSSPELGYWQIAIRAIRVGNRTLDFCNDGTCRAVVDTGTSLLAVPSAFSDILQDELEGPLKDPPPSVGNSGGEDEVDCRKAEGALLHFDIDGSTLTLAPGDYSRPAIQLRDEDLEPAADGASRATSEGPADRVADEPPRATCQPTLMGIDLPEPLGPKLFIMGEPVLRKYYTVYDWAEKRVGFGIAVHSHDLPTEAQQHQEPAAQAEAAKKPTLRRRPLLL